MRRTCDNIDAQNPTRIGLLGSGRVNAFRALSDACSTNALNRPEIVIRPLLSSFSLHWPKVGCADEYEVQSAATFDGTYALLATTIDTSYTSPALDLQRFYRVIAR
jgi:hypothetical protein